MKGIQESKERQSRRNR